MPTSGLCAWLREDGAYELFSFDKNGTYDRRTSIKEHGGRWNAENKRWVVSEDALAPLGAQRMMRVLCHCGTDKTFTHFDKEPEGTAVVGKTVHRPDCWRCLGEQQSVILEVLGPWVADPTLKPWQPHGQVDL